MANNGIYYSSGNTLNFTTDNTTWATLTSGGTFVINTVSGGTYLNLPPSTGSTSGAYLPLSGGTMTGGLVANSGLTASTISQTTYIDFTTGSTNPTQTGGRMFFDNTSKALSYYDVDNNLLPIAMGQQLYTRVYNGTGGQIDKGKVVTITGTTIGLPSIILAVNNHALGTPRPIGVAAEDIPNGGTGLIINNGILSGITLNTFANGDILYLSDTIPGGYVNSTSSLAFSARTNEIGYVLQTGTTTGKIYVNINNEDSNLTLTDIERNILEGNVISSGVYEYTGMTLGTGQTINIASARGWIVRNTYSFATLPDVTNVYYPGGTNIPITNLATADATFILINSASTLVQQTTFPTPQERRENIFLGKVVHPSRTSITSLNQTVDFDVSPMAAIRDLWTPLKLINQGVLVSPTGTGMTINTSSGTLWGNGIGWVTNQQNPDGVTISGTSPTTFQYRTQLGPLTGGSVTTGNTTTIDPGYYDLNGVVTAVGGGSNSSTNQRVYLFPTGLVRIQLGQKVYGTLAEAVAGSQTEQFVEYSLNRENGILIGIISLNKSASNLSDVAQAVVNLVSKFGEVLGGTGGLSTTTLQQAYDNSVTPEIVTNSAEGALSIQNGTGAADNVTNLFEGRNTATSLTSLIRADGAFSGTSIYGTGLTASTINANTISTITVNGNLTVTGTTNISGVTTFNSAPVFNNLTNSPQINALVIDTSTGISYLNSNFINTINGSTGISASTSAGVTTITNTAPDQTVTITGGTNIQIVSSYPSFGINYTGQTSFPYLPLSGGTVTGATIFTGGLTANTISATTYQNLPFSGTITGNGTSNYLPKWTGTTALGDSLVYDSTTGITIGTGFTWDNTNSRLGIGISTPTKRLEVYDSGSGDGLSVVRSSVTTQRIELIPNDSTASALIKGGGNSKPFYIASWANGGTAQPLYFGTNYSSGINEVRMSIDTTGNVGIGTITASTKLDVRGTTRLSATTGTSLTVISSGNSTSSPVFSVQGSQGELFSVTDSLTGSLFSVSDISGLPILEVFSDSTTVIGDYQSPSLYTTKRMTITASTGTTIYSIPTSAYTSSFIDYNVSGSTGLRAGNIMAIWSGTSVNFTETSTNDLGNTTPLTFGFVMSGSSAVLQASASTSTWIVKTIVRGL
jgi:hypothetical protein